MVAKGSTLSEETKAKISKALKGKPNSFWLGRKHTEDSKKRMSEAHKGSYPNEETRHKLSEAKKGNTNCVGYKHSSDTKEKCQNLV